MSPRLFFCTIPAAMLGMIATGVAVTLDFPAPGIGLFAFVLTFLFGWGVTAPRTGRGECFDELGKDQPERDREDNGNPPCPACDHWMAEDSKNTNQYYCTNDCPLARVRLSTNAIIQLLEKQSPLGN